MDIQAAFEKAYWKLEPTLPDDKKDLAAATLRSIALNYIERKGPKPPKTLLKSINNSTTHCSREKGTLNRLSEESFPRK